MLPDMKSTSKLLFIISFSCLVAGCSIFNSSKSLSTEYMPLSLGNKWYYTYNQSSGDNESESIVEVISTDTILDKKYYRLRDLTITPDSTYDYYYHKRLSQDTLFTLYHDSGRKQYVEIIDAIFSMKLNETAEVEPILIPPKQQNEPEENNLPSGHYTIKLISKNNDEAEYFTFRAIDGADTSIYRKGVGLVKSKGSWGVVKVLKDYTLRE